MSGVHRKERGESRSIYTAIVHDLDFVPLSPHAKLLWYTLRLELGASGIGVMYQAQLPDPTGLSLFDVDAALQELCVTQWLVRERNVMWLRNALRFDPYLSMTHRQHVAAVVNHLQGLPRLEIINLFCRYYGLDQAWLTEGVPEKLPDIDPSTLWQWVPLPSAIAPPPPSGHQEVGSRSKEVGERTPTSDRAKKKRAMPTYGEEFLKLWKLHARGSKARANEAYLAATGNGVTYERISTALARYVREKIRADFEGAHLFRWIRDERWEEYEVERPTPPPADSRPSWQAAKETAEQEAAAAVGKRFRGFVPVITERPTNPTPHDSGSPRGNVSISLPGNPDEGFAA